MTAAIAVTPKAKIGFCPCPTANEVITLAPSPATIKEFNQSLRELLYITLAYYFQPATNERSVEYRAFRRVYDLASAVLLRTVMPDNFS